MLRYAYNAREEERESIDRGVDALNDENARRFAMTIAERLRQEGREEGRQEEKIYMIQKLIGKRFGKIPASLQNRLENSDGEALDRFLDDILDFEDLKSAQRWWDARDKTGNA
jgi:predicted transposase YdaD